MFRHVWENKGKTWLWAVFFLLGTVNIWAQTINVQGVVLDPNGEPVIGANVVEKGTPNGNITNIDGQFVLSVPGNAVLVVSYIGYIQQEVPVNGQTSITVTLNEDMQKLDEVVVVGFGTQKKANLTGSVANVDNKLFENRPLSNVSSGLQGLLPGVIVTQSSGQPGEDVGTINVRGMGTINSAEPMVVVDGMESTINDIDPNDIETISVLKDAASAAIYGSKAANGVILISTKRGKSGKPMLSYTGNFGFTSATRIPKFFSSADVASYWNAALKYQGQSPKYTEEEIRKFRDGSDPENYANTDWIDLIYKNSFQHTHNVNLLGGNDMARYMTSVGYQGQDGIINNYSKEQYSMRMNLDMNPSNNLETSFSMAYTRQDVMSPVGSYDNGSTAQILRLANRISPMVTAKYKDGTYGAISDGNPLAWIEAGGKQNKQIHNFSGIGTATYSILPGLSVKGQLAYKLYMEDLDKYTKRIQYNPTYTQGTTSKEVTNMRWDRVSLDILPEYRKSFGQHNLNILGGFHSELYTYKESYGYRKDYPNTEVTDLNAGAAATAKAEGFTRELAIISWLGRINYDYAGKYLFEANIRYDGSSRFAKDNRWGTFPSVSAGWRISEEDFFDSLKEAINNLKVRASWGLLGNQEVLNADKESVYYPTIPTMTLGKDYPLGGSLESGAITYYAVNPDLKWETTETWGIGLDLNLFHKINFTADYFSKTTSDILMKMETAPMYALSDFYANIGKIRNSGFEFDLQYNDRFGKFDFSFGGNIAFINNEVLEIGIDQNQEGALNYIYVTNIDNYTAVNMIGKPMNSLYGYKSAGIFRTQAELDSWPEYKFTSRQRALGDLKYVDTNGDGVITADDRIANGSTNPGIVFGFNIGASWNNFDIHAFFQGAADVSRYISEGRGGLSDSTSKPHELWYDSWSEDNPNAKYPRLATDGYGISGDESSFWEQDASYLRMKDLQIGYTFPRNILNSLGVSRLRVYYSGQNLFTLTGMLSGWDPEAPAGRGNAYPQTIVNSFGLNLTF
ncbi:MAG: TonB-dependent receptor [Tannerellaceae bacterium]|nr:TonB-dependent receptor [Tannerellaceae bacterium]